MIHTHFPRRDGETRFTQAEIKKMKKGAGICFQLVTVYIQHEKYASVSIPRGFRASNKTAKKKKWCLKRKSVTWIFILRLNKGNKPRHIPENQYTG